MRIYRSNFLQANLKKEIVREISGQNQFLEA